MSDIDVVTAFCAECGKGRSAMRAAFADYFLPTTIWENVGMATTTGVEEALALLDGFEANAGGAYFSVEMLAIAQGGKYVLTERIDHLLDNAGQEVIALRLMGIFEVNGDKIVSWRDYFDTAALAGSAA